jgi:hypothetical protein|tara:strand:+ start:258 stop:371 length:114 start_codon:yes stop_codon:yes gene_type:complete
MKNLFPIDSPKGLYKKAQGNFLGIEANIILSPEGEKL